MKKSLFMILISLFFMSISISNGITYNSNTPMFWFDVKGITDKDATSPPGLGDGIPDTKIDLLPCQKVWIDLLISGVHSDQVGLGLMSIGRLDIYYNNPSLFTWEPGVHPSVKMDNWPSFRKLEWVEPGKLHLEGGAPLGTGYYGDNIEVALLDFHCNGKYGSSKLTLEYGMMFLSDGTDISTLTQYIPIEINQVPIPGAIILLGSGLLGLIGLKRKFRDRL